MLPCRLGRALLSHGKQVLLFDMRKPTEAYDNMTYIEGDLREYESVLSALTQHGQVATVFHVAAYGMSGSDQLTRKLTYDINVKVGFVMLCDGPACCCWVT